MKLILLLFFASVAVAQAPSPPKTPDIPLKEQYWHAIGAYWQQTAAFQRTLSDPQKKLQDSIGKIESEIGDIRLKLKADCAKRQPPQDFDDTGTDADCKEIVKK